MIRIKKTAKAVPEPVNPPQTLRKMPAIWHGEYCAELFFTAWPAAPGEAILLHMEEHERRYLEAHGEALPEHLEAAQEWFREGYRRQWEKLSAAKPVQPKGIYADE